MVSRFMLGTGAAVITTGLVVTAATAAVPAGPGVAWGAGSNGRLGSGDTKDTLTPKAVAGPSFTDITAGSFHSCGISGGQVFCWGSGGNGRLGTGTTAESLVPVQVPIPGATLVAVTAGSRHTCALSSDGRAFCWGEGGSGRLGTGNTADSLVPVPVVTSAALAGKTLVAISAGWDFTCALDSGNQAYCWGFGAAGQLGNGSSGNKYTPTLVSGTWTSIDAGVNHTCAISTASAAWCWGDGTVGQLGNDSSASSSIPVPVASADTYRSLSAGDQFTCALTTAAAAFCWGEGESGRLGNDSVTRRRTPVAVITSGVLGGRALSAVTAGSSHACVLDSGGQAFCWGSGYAGRLGTGNATSARVPVAVDTSGTLLGRSLLALSAGPGDTLGIVSGGPLPTEPMAPTSVQAVAGDHQATVSWSPSGDGGAPITAYTVTSKPGNHECTAVGTSCVVSELGMNRQYAFVVTATNRIGTSLPSNLSAPVIPFGPPVRPSITTLTVRVQSKRVQVQWESFPADAQASYQILKRKGKFTAWKKVRKSPVKLKVAPKRRYVLKMRVKSELGYSPVRVVRFRTK